MRLTLADAARIEPMDVQRDGAFSSLGSLNRATPERLVFIEDAEYIAAVEADESITCAITTPQLAQDVASIRSIGVATTGNPRAAFFRFHNHLAAQTDFYGTPFETEIAPTAQVHPSAVIASRNIRIGPGCIIEPGVTVLEGSVLGEGVILRAGSTIGSQGYEFKRIDGHVLPVAHAGGARLADAVEVQAHTVICRSIFGGYTEIGEETKIDNLVHVAHNVTVGKRTFIIALAMIGGSVTIGDDVWIGPGAVISNGIHIGDGATIALGAIVTRDVEPGARVLGATVRSSTTAFPRVKS